MRLIRRSASIAAALALLSLAACSGAPDTAADEAGVTATLEAFYGAMKTGDTAQAMAQIAPDAEFVESGRIETRDQYEKNHFPNDFAFEKQITGKRTPWNIKLRGDTAWVIATTEYEGVVDGEDVDFASTQLAVLTRETEGWRIRSIHWSSRRR